MGTQHTQQRKRAERQFKRENAIASREEAKKYHDLVVKRKKEAKKLRDEQVQSRASFCLECEAVLECASRVPWQWC